ncbi:MAG: hypothetical protein MJ136_06310 [Clostridia bacterium]|nr:hypothetical protein [Clostridia bacterium]
MLTPQMTTILTGINALWLLILLWWSALLLFIEARSRRIRQALLTILLTVLTFVMVQCHFLTPEDAVAVPFLGQIADLWAQLPCTLISVFSAVLTALLVTLSVHYRRWTQSHISYQTFREAVNCLPAGVCCYR